jgi:hypothetical protein
MQNDMTIEQAINIHNSMALPKLDDRIKEAIETYSKAFGKRWGPAMEQTTCEAVTVLVKTALMVDRKRPMKAMLAMKKLLESVTVPPAATMLKTNPNDPDEVPAYALIPGAALAEFSKVMCEAPLWEWDPPVNQN